MRVILSRKGFDAKNGGIASPILPDGTLLSLPIPEACGKPYKELIYDGVTYETIISQLKAKTKETTCHLDPDIRTNISDIPAEWKPAFGQSGIPLKTLNKQNIGVGDLFLFFGWFRQTDYIDGELKFKAGAPDLHIVFGYMQIGELVSNQVEIDSKYSWHPHANMNIAENCLYIPRHSLSWDSAKPAFGTFKYDTRLVLTKDGTNHRGYWKPLDIFTKMSGQYKDALHEDDPQYGDFFKAMDIEQGFIFEQDTDVEKWAKSLF